MSQLLFCQAVPASLWISEKQRFHPSCHIFIRRLGFKVIILFSLRAINAIHFHSDRYRPQPVHVVHHYSRRHELAYIWQCHQHPKPVCLRGWRFSLPNHRACPSYLSALDSQPGWNRCYSDCADPIDSFHQEPDARIWGWPLKPTTAPSFEVVGKRLLSELIRIWCSN